MGYEAKSQTGVAVASGSTTTLNLSLNTGSIVYIYDDVGRLAAAVDTGGDTAVYSYDAVGNLLSISRQSSSAVTVLGFSPNSGPVGASVTINGTGFSATAGDNTVKFNGVVATVNSASVTQIVASVPFGASSGGISVTAPTGSATSATVFTVTSAMGAPTITGFTPQVAKIGDAVTIAGTNFDTNPVNDKVTINLTGAQVGSATATSISTSVSSRTGSGKITVSTPAGSAVSNADFFVVPLSNPADVEFTSRMAIGESKVVTINTPGKAGAILFEGTIGQKVSLTATNVTISAAYVGIYDPYGATFGGQTTVSSSGGFIDGQTLIMNGTYMILVTAWTGFSGSMTLTLNDARDAIGTITPGGPSVTVTTNVPGQNARYTFSGTAGQKVSLKFTNSMIGNGNGAVTIYSPDGAIWASFSNVTGGLFMDTRTLTVPGTYTIVTDPYYTLTGNIVTLTLYDITDVTGSMTPGGPSVTVTMSVPGQNANLTFDGSAGQKVSLNISGVTIVPHGSTASVLNPDGSTLFSGTFGPSGNFIDNLNLASTGTYTIVVNPSIDDLGSATLTLYDTAEVTATITPGGASVPITITTPGQNARLTFSGNAGQKVSLSMGNVTIQFSTVTIYQPDATVLASGSSGMSGGFIDTQTLTVSGTYTILVDPSSSYTGNITLTLYDVSDVAGTITPGGAPVIATIGTPGQNAALTFNGTAGQKVSLKMSGVTIVTSTVSIIKPDGASLISTSVNTSGNFIDTQTLPASGTYTIRLDPSSSYTGSLTLTLYDVPPDVTGSMTIGGQAATVTIATPGQNAQVTFAGTSGQQVTVRVTNSTMGCVTVRLLKSDGSTLTSTTYCANGNFNLTTQTLPATDTYTVSIDPQLANTGSMNVNVTSP